MTGFISGGAGGVVVVEVTGGVWMGCAGGVCVDVAGGVLAVCAGGVGVLGVTIDATGNGDAVCVGSGFGGSDFGGSGGLTGWRSLSSRISRIVLSSSLPIFSASRRRCTRLTVGLKFKPIRSMTAVWFSGLRKDSADAMDNSNELSSTASQTDLVASERRMIRFSLLVLIPISFASIASLFSSSALGSPRFFLPALRFIAVILFRNVRERS